MEQSFISEKIYLSDADDRVFLDVYAMHDETNEVRDAVLVIPGGAYAGVSWREGVYTALALVGRGVNAFVLTYSVGEHAVYPRQLTDAASALKYIKDNAERYHIDPNRIFALGYSAGGHLLGTLTTQYNYAEELLGAPKDSLKIRGAIFCYPVLTAYGKTHVGSYKNLLKKPFEEMTEDERNALSIERCITPETPPAFIWHTSDDSGVNVINLSLPCLNIRSQREIMSKKDIDSPLLLADFFFPVKEKHHLKSQHSHPVFDGWFFINSSRGMGLQSSDPAPW